MVALVDEGVHGEDLGCHDADWFSMAWMTVSWFFERCATSRIRKRTSFSDFTRESAASESARDTVSSSEIA